MRAIPDDNLSYPIFLQWDSGQSGSGFYFNNDDKELYIVTARHVLFENKKMNEKDPDNFILISNKLKVTSYSRDITCREPIIAEINFDILDKSNLRFSKSNDVAIIKIANFESSAKGSEKKNFDLEKGYNITSRPAGEHGLVGIPNNYFKKFEDVLISNDVIIFGYPVSLGTGLEIEKERPLLRKGIVAGKNYKNRTIILDCPVYQGNSGGLAIEISADGKKTNAIGIISQFIPFFELTQSLHFKYLNKNIENSGYSVVVPIDVVLTLL